MSAVSQLLQQELAGICTSGLAVSGDRCTAKAPTWSATLRYLRTDRSCGRSGPEKIHYRADI